MGLFIWILGFAFITYLFFRLRRTFRWAKQGDRSEEIRRQLAELRKKRDEE